MSEQVNMAAHYEHEIPEGYEARIEGNKVIIEPKESEDERVRKEIIDYFHGCIRRNKKSGFRLEQYKSWIAYLEKQKDIFGERAKNITANMLEDGIGGIQRELIEFLSNTVNASWVDVIKSADAYAERIRNIIEKQKEQKPLSTEETELNSIAFLEQMGYTCIPPGKLQKSTEWSDEYCEEGLRTRFAIYTYKNEDGVLYLSNVFVEEASRNKGFGTKILQATEKVAETIGAITIRLKVKRNSPANDWYRKRGYKYLTVEGEYDWLEKNLEYMKPSKPAEWSEEDKYILKNIHDFIKENTINPNRVNCAGECLNWLISLPERFNLRPKQEWSEEDELMRTTIIQTLDLIGDRGTVRMQQNWLKSLRPQPHWKPSLATADLENNLCDIQDNYPDGSHEYKVLGEAIEFIRSTESHWKPSELQMFALDSAILMFHNLKRGGDKEELQSLYNDLKKLM